MLKGSAAASPDAYVAGLDGWRRDLVDRLRVAATWVDGPREVIKWGHIVYLANGPALLIRAEDERVLFGFWRGQRLRELEPRLKPGGKYEMATIDLREGDTIDPAIARALVRRAVELNAEVGDPAKAARAG